MLHSILERRPYIKKNHFKNPLFYTLSESQTLLWYILYKILKLVLKKSSHIICTDVVDYNEINLFFWIPNDRGENVPFSFPFCSSRRKYWIVILKRKEKKNEKAGDPTVIDVTGGNVEPVPQFRSNIKKKEHQLRMLVDLHSRFLINHHVALFFPAQTKRRKVAVGRRSWNVTW